jgi:hypothetical protein
MIIPTMFERLFSTQLLHLPEALTMQLYLRASWAVVLVWVVLNLARPLLAGKLRDALVLVAGLVGVWALLPGELSPAYWLGLAFQAPSLITTGLAALAVFQMLQPSDPCAGLPPSGQPWGWVMCLPVLLGWALLLDTFAVFPVSVYALGFSSAALALTVLVVLILGLVAVKFAGRSFAMGRVQLGMVFGVLAVFVLLRLPTGNLWDALLDPWLWVALHVLALRRVFGWFKAQWFESTTTRV